MLARARSGRLPMADRHGPALQREVRVAVEREAVVPAAEETEAVEQAVEAKVVVAWAAEDGGRGEGSGGEGGGQMAA